jgi:transcription elongation factor GreA
MQIPKRKSEAKVRTSFDPHITRDKYDELSAELEKIKNVKRPRAADEVKRLAEMGDFSENAAYQMAKGYLRRLNSRILEIEDILKRAIIITPDKMSSTVKMGSKVTVEIRGKQQVYTILGSREANPGAGAISHQSPLGEALLGGQVGEVVEVKMKGGEVECKILKIE